MALLANAREGRAAVRTRPRGFALRSKRGPARKTADSAERRCRCPTVVAQPGAAKLQQLHHVPVMLRCSGAGPPARSHQSAVRTRLSSWGDFPIFWVNRPVNRGPWPWPKKSSAAITAASVASRIRWTCPLRLTTAETSSASEVSLISTDGKRSRSRCLPGRWADPGARALT